jgi:hypothetical protein
MPTTLTREFWGDRELAERIAKAATTPEVEIELREFRAGRWELQFTGVRRLAQLAKAKANNEFWVI